MSQPEARISRSILKAIRAEGVFAYKVHGNELVMAGLPDIIACVDGFFLGLETKQPRARNNLSKRQRYVHEQISAASGVVVTVCSAREALIVVRGLRNVLGARGRPLSSRQTRALILKLQGRLQDLSREP